MDIKCPYNPRALLTTYVSLLCRYRRLSFHLSTDRRRYGFMYPNLHIGRRNEDVQYTIGVTVLNRPTTAKEKDLGFTVSADMKVSEQCGIAASHVNQRFVLIRRNIVYKEK